MTPTRPTPSDDPSHDSPKASLEQDVQLRLTRGRPRAVVAVMTRLRTASSEKRISDSLEDISSDTPRATRLGQPLSF
jgi:hypothetical protein